MKKINAALVISLFVMTGCGGNKQLTDDCITVDVSADYPKKELILQDFMDVEYVPLETTDDFITQGIVKATGKKILLVANRIMDGNIFVFDRATGKGLRKINRLGQSGEEYSHITSIVLDEDNNEMFVVDYPARKILVYDLYGEFNRSLPFPDTCYYEFLSDYDRDHLIGYKSYLPLIETDELCHVLISKKDGSVTRKIQIPFKELETPVVTKDEAIVTPVFFLITPHDGNCLLTKTSSDTVYNYLPDGTLSPFIVRTPSIHSMDPKVFLFPTIITDRYYFMQTLDKKFNFEKGRGFPTNDLVYDKQEKAIFQYTVYNDDFSNKHRVALGQQPEKSVDEEIVTCRALNASDLVEANEKGELKGKLKEIAAGLNEESNSVIMLIKRKK